MLKTEFVHISKIHISKELSKVQNLMPIGKDDKEQLKASIKKYGIRDPLKAYKRDDHYFILGWIK